MGEAAAQADSAVHVVAGELGRADSRSRAEWDGFLEGRPESTLYHTTGWLGVVGEAFGKPAHLLSARDSSGEVQGVLPLVEIRSRLMGHRFVSVPYCNYGGVIATDLNVAEELRQEAVRMAGQSGASLEMRELGDPLRGWAGRSDKVIMKLRLPESADALGASIGSKRRSQVRRAAKEGATVEHGGIELLADFYSVFCRNMRDLGTPVYPRRFFEVILHRLGDRARFVVVSVKGEPAAAALLMEWRRCLEIPWASSVREFNPIGVNMFLYWEAITSAIEAGCAEFDFGRSTVDSGTFRFKKQWGAEPEACRWLDWPRSSDATDGGRIRHWGSSAWKHLPLAVANRLGPIVSPNLPW